MIIWYSLLTWHHCQYICIMYIVNYSLFSKADGKGVIFRLSFSGWTYRWYKIRLKQAVTFLGLRISLSSQEMRHPKDLEARLFVLVLSVHHLNQTLSCREAGFPKYFSLIEVVATEAILVHPPSSPSRNLVGNVLGQNCQRVRVAWKCFVSKLF